MEFIPANELKMAPIIGVVKLNYVFYASQANGIIGNLSTSGFEPESFHGDKKTRKRKQ